MCLAKGHASGMARPARRKAERAACSNRIRGMLGEFGVVFAQGATALRQALSGVIEDASNELPGMARLVIQQAQTHWAQLNAHIQWCDERIEAHIKQDAHAKQATQLMGVGPITASAVVATVGDFKQFKHGAQFGAWLGLVPKQNSSGGKNNLALCGAAFAAPRSTNGDPLRGLYLGPRWRQTSATRPSVDVQSDSGFTAASSHANAGIPFIKEEMQIPIPIPIPMLDYLGSPCQGLEALSIGFTTNFLF